MPGAKRDTYLRSAIDSAMYSLGDRFTGFGILGDSQAGVCDTITSINGFDYSN